ncbi:MAG: hypothetical protein ABGY24_00445, partial [bacterium]
SRVRDRLDALSSFQTLTDWSLEPVASCEPVQFQSKQKICRVVGDRSLVRGRVCREDQRGKRASFAWGWRYRWSPSERGERTQCRIERVSELLPAGSDGGHHHETTILARLAVWESVSDNRGPCSFHPRSSVPRRCVQRTLFLCAERTSCVRQEVGAEEEPM